MGCVRALERRRDLRSTGLNSVVKDILRTTTVHGVEDAVFLEQVINDRLLVSN